MPSSTAVLTVITVLANLTLISGYSAWTDMPSLRKEALTHHSNSSSFPGEVEEALEHDVDGQNVA